MATYIAGDNFANLLFGTTGDDVINGFDGLDRLYGREGNDVLVGGRGGNVYYGGAGNDLFVVDEDSGLTIVEYAGEGIDTLMTAGDTPGWANVENYILSRGVLPGSLPAMSL